MSRLAETFARLAREGRKALIPFVTAGDPQPDFTVPLLHDLVAAGADIIELGVPFSDPMADGPVIQRASERALQHRMSLRKTLMMVAEFRRRNQTTPVVLMGYLNPIECLGYEAFANTAQRVEIDGVLTVDMPPEEAGELTTLLRERAIDPIFLIAPNTSDTRVQQMDAIGSGYLYYVSLKGVTGATTLDTRCVTTRLTELRHLTTLPLCVGFGVKDATSAREVARFADGVVIGSALISVLEHQLNDLSRARDEMITLIASLRRALDT